MPARLRESEMHRLVSLYRSGQFTETETKARALISQFPGEPKLRSILCLTLAKKGKLEDASSGYRELLDIVPNDAEAHNNLGVILTQRSMQEEAITSYRRAIEIKPNYVNAHSNLGDALLNIGRPAEAASACRQALKIDPNFGPAHNFLGSALLTLGELDESVKSYHSALRSMPQSPEINTNLGSVLLDLQRTTEAIQFLEKAISFSSEYEPAYYLMGNIQSARGDYKKAAQFYERSSTQESHAKILECFYALNDIQAFDNKLKNMSDTDPKNIRAAAVSAFSAQQRKTTDIYSFCEAPLAFVSVIDLFADSSLNIDKENMSAEAIKMEVEAVTDFVWEPPGITTTRGYQSSGDLFRLNSPNLIKLEKAIRKTINEYHVHHAKSTCGFISKWPEHYKLNAWYVRLLKNGYQDSHIHPGGWLSGVFYLKIPENLDGQEGSIEFSLHGYDYPIRTNDIPSKSHKPRAGELVLFPSSLFHRTIPFSKDVERHCISFDLEPQKLS